VRALSTVLVSALAAATGLAQQGPLVVLAISRAGHIEMFDSRSLARLGTMRVNQPAESVHASPDGRRLYVAAGSEPTKDECCGLFSLDLETRQMCLLASPAMFGLPSSDGSYLFTQRSGGSVDVFDGESLKRLPGMQAPGVYSLHPVPYDRRHLFGVTNFPKPSLDVFDVEHARLERRLALPAGPVTGAWVGDRFVVFHYDGHGGELWRVSQWNPTLPSATQVHLPDLEGDCDEPMLLMLAGGRARLFLAEAFGFKVDRRSACAGAARGGIFAIDPTTGSVDYRIAEWAHVNRMKVTPGGTELYVLDSSGPGQPAEMHLLRLDAWTGRILASRELPAGTWNLALAQIPSSLIPSGYVRARPCRH
jgi:hypothetical protein